MAKLKNIKALDIIPYHRMGEEKYKKMKIPFPLPNTLATTQEEATNVLKSIVKNIKDTLKKKNSNID